MEGKRGQAAVEYMALVGLVLLFSTPLLVQAQQSAVEIPGGVNSSSVGPRHLHLEMAESRGGSDLYEFLEFNVTGDIPVDRGRHRMVAEAVTETNVSIHPR